MRRAGAKRKPRRARGTLVLIAGLLIASAVLRAVGDVGQAWARVPADATARTADAPVACKTEDDLHAMLKGFQKRETRLKEQENTLAERERALVDASRQIESELVRLEAAEDELRRTLTMADTAAETDVGRLVKVYESMKPKQAAALFEEMTPVFAAGFLGRMRPEAAAGIMANLSPEAAHTFSVVLAGRNAGAPAD
jgi:flagellar motility protein MotE (MotC chaperone)